MTDTDAADGNVTRAWAGITDPTRKSAMFFKLHQLQASAAAAAAAAAAAWMLRRDALPRASRPCRRRRESAALQGPSAGAPGRHDWPLSHALVCVCARVAGCGR